MRRAPSRSLNDPSSLVMEKWVCSGPPGTIITALQRTITNACTSTFPITDTELRNILNAMMDAQDNLHGIVAARSITNRHANYSFVSTSTIPDIFCQDVSLLTFLIDRRQRDNIRLLLEYGADVQGDTDWLICLELLYESSCSSSSQNESSALSTKTSNNDYDPIVGMLEDCAEYHPPLHEDYMCALDADMSLRAPHVNDFANFLERFLHRHGSLFHMYCWSTICSGNIWPELYPALQKDLLSFRWRWHLVVYSMASEYHNWLTESLLTEGIIEHKTSKKPLIVGSLVHSLRQQLICPLSIMISTQYSHSQYDTTRYLIKQFHEKVVPQSGNDILIDCYPYLCQELINMILFRAPDASITFLKFLVNTMGGNPNARYVFNKTHDEGFKLQSVYQDILSAKDDAFTGPLARQGYLSMLIHRLQPDPIHAVHGKTILCKLCGQNIYGRFTYLVEEAHADPLLLIGKRPNQTSPYHQLASHNHNYSIINYYVNNKLISSINRCFLDNMTPLMIACTTVGYNPQTISFLDEKYQAAVNVKNNMGETALMIAIKHECYDAAVRLFTVYGRERIDVDLCDSTGKSLRDLIFENGMYYGNLMKLLPESWRKHKLDWDVVHKAEEEDIEDEDDGIFA